MKYYNCVLKKAEETNYKKGIRRISEESDSYKITRKLHFLSFLWFLVFQVLYIISNLTVYLVYDDPHSVAAVNKPLLITSCIVFFGMIAARVLLRYKLQIFTLILTVVLGIAQMHMLGQIEALDKNNAAMIGKSILSTKYFWFHHAPIILMMFFALILFAIGLVRRINLKKDYEKALSSMFASYSEKNPDASDADWTAHLEELDLEITEEKTNQTENKKRKK